MRGKCRLASVRHLPRTYFTLPRWNRRALTARAGALTVDFSHPPFMSGHAVPTSVASSNTLPIPAERGLGLITLRAASPLTIHVLPNGALYAIRHGPTLINQLLPGPAENGLFRLLLREHGNSGAIVRHAALTGAGIPFSHTGTSVTWLLESGGPGALEGVRGTTTLELHPQLAAWRWRVRFENTGGTARRFDVLHAQDLGLADEPAVRNNEAYISQYIDWLPIADAALGWVLCARQNQAMADGHHPWMALACAPRAEAFCTDGWQFFGPDHRLTGEPLAVRVPCLPSKRLQYEFALAGLQSRAVEIAPGAAAEIAFVARFVADHAQASSPDDRALVRELAAGWRLGAPNGSSNRRTEAPSFFVRAPWQHGDEPTEEDLLAWFPGPHRHVERSADGRPLAFFCGQQTHVVTRTKEALVARPHGHILRSGDVAWIDDRRFGLTAYAAGVFSAQSFHGNSSLLRLLPVVRNALGIVRGAGQRVFVRLQGEWRQLGVPSAFAMTPGDVRWWYRIGGDIIEARAWCSRALAASFLDLRSAGAPCEFLIAHQLVLGANEFENSGAAQMFAPEGWVACTPGSEALAAQRLPGAAFALAVNDPAVVAQLGGDELLYADGGRRGGPYVVFRTRATNQCGVIQAATLDGLPGLMTVLAAARTEFAGAVAPAAPLPLNLRLDGVSDPRLGRINEVLPWFNHNAAIHFSAPHGLEQYGGAAWGVRDVCQGSLEWLLAAGRFDYVRRMLLTVFAQQYFAADDRDPALMGTWPQWFMFPPFHAIQQAHSHGDVCFWPVKALCDYVEASNDFRILEMLVGYTDPRTFGAAGPKDSLWVHCDRVIAHVMARFVAGTTLVDYGDGDWDDTLQPADPKMRTHLVSAWTVGLAYQTFRQLAEIAQRAGEAARAARLQALLTPMRADFAARMMPDGIVAGFLVHGNGAESRPLLHPRDQVTEIRYRLLPMTRSILAELFTPDEVSRHREIIDRELLYPDGVRLMSEPAKYHGGLARLFKRAETAANVGREIGLQYVHAHLRYAEAMAKVGDAERLWAALQVVNPVGLREILANAAPRQSNVYFSSSDADFPDRYEAEERWSELRSGQVPVRGGWRLYSSGPGLFLHQVRACLLGIRESFGDVVFDPVLPRSLHGLIAQVDLCGLPTQVRYRVERETHGPSVILVNGMRMKATREPNPYRCGGLRVTGYELGALLGAAGNKIEVAL